MGTNKVGFTVEQQAALMRVLNLARLSSNIVSTATARRPDGELEEVIAALVDFVLDSYPNGPLTLRDELQEVLRFCDMPTIIRAENAKGEIV